MPKGDNLHRVVIFKDDALKANQVLSFSTLDSEDPEDLWAEKTIVDEHARFI
jgi:hypothetical protein